MIRMSQDAEKNQISAHPQDGDRAIAAPQPPVMWPRVSTEGLIVTPVLTDSFWLALVKETQAGALSDDQKKRLRDIGFIPGEGGRMLRPGRMGIKDLESMSRILNAPLDVTQPDQLVYLKNGNALEPAVPLEIQAGIRWYWKTHPQHLLDEIKASLAQRDDELSSQTLDILNTQKIDNPTRLRRWVAQALTGEISAVTEPILGLGLQKAGQTYGDINEWPEELQQWHRRLAEERGDDLEQSDEVAASTALADQMRPEMRPSVGSRIQWTDNGQAVKGVVIEHDEDPDHLWVSTGRPRALDGEVVFPERQRIIVDDILGFSRPQPPSAQASATKAPKAPSATPAPKAPANPERLKPQPALTYQELDPAYQFVSRGLSFDERERLVLEIACMTSGMKGHSPLIPASGATPMVEYWYGSTRQMLANKEAPEDDVIHEASVVVRDALLDRFNNAQPQTEDGARSPLAVYPMPVPGAEAVPHLDSEGVNAQALEALQNSELCFVGIHPAHMPVVREAMLNAIASMDPFLKEKGIGDVQNLSSAITNTASTIMGAGQATVAQEAALASNADLVGRATRAAHLLVRARDVSLEQYATLITEHRDAISEWTGNRVLPTYEAAHQWISGQAETFQDVVQRNERLLNSIGELANVSASDLNNTPHPVLAAVNALEEQGILDAESKGHALAQLNIDLSRNPELVGELAQMHGVNIALAHDRAIKQEAEETADGQRIPVTHRQVTSATTTTGWIETPDTAIPYQVTFAAATPNLIEDTLQRETAMQREQHPLRGETQLTHSTQAGSAHSLLHDRVLAGTNPLVATGRLLDLYANADLALGKPVDMESVDEADLDNLPVNIYAMDHLGHLSDAVDSPTRHPLSGLDMTRYPRVPGDAIGDNHSSTLNQHILGQRSALLTLTPQWRQNPEQSDQIREAIALWVDDQKALKKLARQDRCVNSIYNALRDAPEAEMVVMAMKATARRVRWIERVVTTDDVMAANNDRSLAIEQAILKMKSSNRETCKGWQFSAFDAATVLRPQALRLLSERREQQRRNMIGGNDDSRPEKSKTRGKRQDRGVVAGLSIKDLRGKTTTVLSNLKNASLSDQGKFITKTKLWETPDWVSLRNPSEDDLNNGERAMEPVAAAFIDIIRKELPSAPPANIPMVSQAYAEMILGIRDALADVRTHSELTELVADKESDLNQAITTVRQRCEALNLSVSLLMGEGATWLKPCEYWLHQAQHKSRNNQHWIVGDANGRKGKVATADETGAMPMLTKLKREGGEDYRGDTDIDEQTMLTTFGFSGVEYGKSMTQADRTEYLNQAYDGFMDMAKALKVSPKALSLGGTLGLAFGSRGRGGRNAALAHFEPANNVINLTRMKGAGSMAHEYGHALANYFYRASRGTPGDRSNGDITEVIDRQLERGVINGQVPLKTGNLRDEVGESIAQIMQHVKYEYRDLETSELPPLNVAAQSLRAPSNLYRGAKTADWHRSKAYWKTPEEMFARSFETWVHETLQQRFEGFRNDFLVRPDKLKAWGVPEDQQPDNTPKRAQLYPSGDQLTMLDKAFTKLVDTLKEKEIDVQHEHLGKIKLPILYSRDTNGIEVLSQSEHDTLALCVMDEVTRMCGDQVWLQWHGNLKDEEGQSVAGRYRDLPESGREDLERKVLGVIDLAYGAKMTTAHHEAFHFAQSHLLTDEEQAALNRSFAKGADLHNRLVSALDKEGQSELIEHCNDPHEAQAYGYQLWVQGKLDIRQEERPATLFGKVRKFFKQVMNIGQDGGFDNADQIFQAFYRGKLAERARQQLATRESLNETEQTEDQDSEDLHSDTSAPITDERVATKPETDDTVVAAHAEVDDDFEQEVRDGPFLG
ncbi:MAG: hypothetical protein AWU57_1021 [Marinobacter sp. T13-3]|nr:MAG: hypothetical protein AWU57_1021 [Marinobacter sp. T13-3]